MHGTTVKMFSELSDLFTPGLLLDDLTVLVEMQRL